MVSDASQFNRELVRTDLEVLLIIFGWPPILEEHDLSLPSEIER